MRAVLNDGSISTQDKLVRQINSCLIECR